ncbi:MAG: tetratricopeptide repeat protein [Deltaproteobacteria bacterium]|nr:tetratricopeptide repeat protein [Deltaproteobacteria bacterium]
MKKKWTMTPLLLILILMVCGCAASSKEEKKSEKVSPGKKEVLQKSEDKKIDKSDEKSGRESEEKRLEQSEARAIRRMAREIARDRGADFYQTGMTEFNKGDFEDAIIAFKKAVDENPKDYQSYYALGRSYEKLARPKEAIASYEAALKIKPDYLPAREAAGLLYFQQKQFQEAEAHLKLARTLESKVAEVYYCLGEIEQREKACKTAIIAYEQALKLNPDYVAARNGLKAAQAACRKKRSSKPLKTIKAQ